MNEHPGGSVGEQRYHSDATSEAFQRVMSWGLICLPMGRSQCSQCLCWKRTSSPSSLLKQAFEILPRCDDLGFAIDTPEPPQAETPHAMPVLGFRKEGFDPDFPLVYGLLIGIRLVV